MHKSILNIYCDESGTMPIDDSTDLFLTASVGVVNQHISFDKKSGHKNWLIDRLKQFNSIPFITFILPKKGYGNIVKAKFDKINTMARYTRLITGRNTHYLDEDGLRIPNFIWSFCMLKSIGNVILNAVDQQEINKIQIFIDDKSFSKPSKMFFINSLFRQLNIMIDSITKLKGYFPSQTNRLLERINKIEGETSLYWRDESDASPAKEGLEIAHYLAYHFRKDFRKKTKTCISKLLTESKYDYFQMDVTELLIQPINEKTIEDWKKNTGLPEPGAT